MGSMPSRTSGVTMRLKQRGSPTENYWTGKVRDALEIAYGTAGTKPNATTMRDRRSSRN